MKKLTIITAIISFLSLTAYAQYDTMYIMKNGAVILKQSIQEKDVDSVIFYNPKLPPGKTFTDARDGNVYVTTTIGDQVWMAENLRYLPTVSPPSAGSSTQARYYVYGYSGNNVTAATETSNYSTYGVLYNWPAAMNGSSSSTSNPSGVQGICPAGWHLPSEAEWKKLADHIGGKNVAGGKLKQVGLTFWESPNSGATNEYNFTGLPSGYRWGGFGGSFTSIGFAGYFWSTNGNGADATIRMLYSYGADFSSYDFSKEYGYSCRCVKD
jgi:uncharacterized protein (TIGR02145 family)